MNNKNPYTYRSIIKRTTMFFGRQAEMRSLYNLLNSMQSCSVVGPRRIGKSSLLYNLCDSANYFKYLENPDSYIFVYIDLQELSNSTLDDFFFTILERIKRAGENRIEVDIEKYASQVGLRRFLFKMQDDGVRIVLCLDEFEMLSQQNQIYQADFFAYLRALCSNYDLALITSSQVSLFELCHQGNLQTSQFWNIFMDLSLGWLNPEDSLQLISKPFADAQMEIDENDIQKIFTLVGYHPFFLQIACYAFWNQRKQNQSFDTEEVLTTFFSETIPHMIYTWDRLNEEEKKFLISGTETGLKDVINEKVLLSLQEKGILRKSSDYSTKPIIFPEMWQTFLKEKIGINLTTQDVLDDRINQSEIGKKFDYMDFDVHFCNEGEHYLAKLQKSPVGQAEISFRIPFTKQDLEIFYLRVSGRQRVRRIESPQMETIKLFGSQLYKILFKDEMFLAFQTSMELARKNNKGLRLRFRMEETPELIDLPWEYLYNPDLNRFLALSTETPVVRFLDLPEAPRPKDFSMPIKILVMICSPKDYPQLEVEEEWLRMKRTFNELEKKGLVILKRLEAPTVSQLRKQLQKEHFQIFHYIGHGHFDDYSQDGQFLFEEEDSHLGRSVSGQELGVLLHDARSMNLAFLNACEAGRTSNSDSFAGVAQSLIQQGIPAVLAMQSEITDDTAILFSKEFYSALAQFYPLDAAVSEARKAIYTEANCIEWGIPVLYLRMTDGNIFGHQGEKGND